MRAIGLVALAACAPSWIHDDFKPHAIAEARHAASARYSCPLPRVELRCDATWSVHATDGDLVVWEPDGSVGTIVASAPQWTFDLDVCGQTRRFAREMPEPHTPFAGFTEEYMPCQGGVCIDRAAGCRSVTAGPLWAVPLAAAPAGCDAAPIDRALAVRVDQSLVGVAVAPSPDPLVLAIDGRWYALRGGTRAPSGELATGVVLAAGSHELALYRAGATCTRSPAVHARVVVKVPTHWVDI